MIRAGASAGQANHRAAKKHLNFGKKGEAPAEGRSLALPCPFKFLARKRQPAGNAARFEFPQVNFYLTPFRAGESGVSYGYSNGRARPDTVHSDGVTLGQGRPRFLGRRPHAPAV